MAGARERVRPVSEKGSIAARGALVILRSYKKWLSPILPPACRFEPTCSEYAMEAISKYGAVRGSWMGLYRLLRCHPFHRGGFDPVP
ncbi:MAG: membrane protein insertion efficiency factor YidD [bacterium]|nr:membrane protein insertion efficiency factor YidD [bacterium]